MALIGGLFKQQRSRYSMNEDEKFYLMSCSDLLGEITSVIDGIGVMHDFFWEKVGASKYEKEMHKCEASAKSTLTEMHEHLVDGLRYFEHSYVESLVYFTDKERKHIAKAIELALLGSAELRDGSKQWDSIKNKTIIKG
ncbi:hypothetical protein C5S31_08670 [ANME-1 cluster archaeon GoMg2]|nr:hypothetical protein [ANME-1 cluster archaeon GoMg2]